MKYSKVHTCDFADERDVESGKEFKVCDFGGIQLGIMICYDREYPESARILMLKGAEVILVPNDCGSMQPRIRALSTRAYENMVAVAMANPNGDNAGCSCAFSPICWDRNGECVDNTVLLADDKTEGILYAELDMEAMALKWVVKDDDVTSVLIGASKPQQIIENLKVMQAADFTQEELALIDEISM